MDEYSIMCSEGQGMTDDTWRIKQFACFVVSLPIKVKRKETLARLDCDREARLQLEMGESC